MAKNNAINSTDLHAFAAQSVLGNTGGSIAPASAVSFGTLRSNLGIAGSTRVVYVRPDGVDGAPNDGSEGLPWATAGYAMSVITTATASNPFVIDVAGRTIETSIALKPHISIQGLAGAQLQMSGTVTLHATFLTSAAESSMTEYCNVAFNTSAISLDFSTGIVYASSPYLRFYDIHGYSAPAVTIIGNGRQIIVMREVYMSLVVSNVFVCNLFTCAVDSLSVSNTISATMQFNAFACIIYTTLTLLRTAGTIAVMLRGIARLNSWTINGTGITVDTDTFITAPTLLNGATFAATTAVGSIKGTSAGGIVWSDATKLNIAAGTATAGLPLLSGASDTPTFSSIVYPASVTANALIYASSTTALGTITSANSALLYTSSSGVPAFASRYVETGAGGTPQYNHFLGTGTGAGGATGGRNLAIGTSAFSAAVAASQNTIVGIGAANVLQSGDNNVVVGTLALSSVTSTLSSQNTIVGSGAAFLQAAYNNSTFIGYAADTTVNNLTNVTVIGYNASTAVSNSVTVGNTSVTSIKLANASYPASTTVNQILYSSANNTLAGLATLANGVLVTDAAGIPSISTTLPTGLAMQTPASLTLTNATSLPLATGVTGILQLSKGGTNAALVAAAGAVPYSTASEMAFLAPTATAGLPMLSGANSAPMWSPFALSLSGAFTTTGAFNITFAAVGSTLLALPVAGTVNTSENYAQSFLLGGM